MGAGPVKSRLPAMGTNMDAQPNLGGEMQSSGVMEISVTPKARVCAVSGDVSGGGSKKKRSPLHVMRATKKNR
jgi:hypothetical protein